jgi:hypothetical protein
MITMQKLIPYAILLSSVVFFNHVYANSRHDLHCNSTLQMQITSEKIADVEQYASRLDCLTPSTQVCMIFDIDNTLITNYPNFGDEAWGSWQSYLSKNDPSNPNLITHWLPNVGLYDTVAALRFLLDFTPVESVTPAVLHDVQNKYPTIALTSRSFTSLSTTERQLLSNDMNFKLNPIGGNPLDPYFLQQHNNQLKMYYNGIYYTAGANKGENLLQLIEHYRNKLNRPNLCSVVIAVDDTSSHIDDMSNALRNKIGYIGIHYTALPKASDPNQWTPDIWLKQSVELKNVIKRLNES